MTFFQTIHSQIALAKETLIKSYDRLKIWLSTKVAQNIPGTSQFKKRTLRAIVKNYRDTLRQFSNLQSIAPLLRGTLLKRVRFHARRLAISDGYDFIIDKVVYLFYYVSFVIMYMGTPFALAIILGIEKPFLIALIYLFPHLFLVALLILPMALIIKILKVFPGNISTTLLFTCLLLMPLGLVISIPQILLHIGNSLRYYILSPVIGAIGFYCIILVSALGKFIFYFFWSKYRNSHIPDSLIVDKLLAILDDIENSPHDWGKLGEKRYLISKIETAANIIQHDIAKQFHTSDQITDIWFSQTSLQIATYLRSYKKWILTSKPDTREHFINQLAQDLIAAISGDWDGFRKETPAHITRPERLFMLLAFARLILLAILPFGIMWLAQKTPLALQDPILEYVKLGTIIWGMLTIISAFDPTFVTKISAIKDLTDIIPFFGKKS